MVVNKKGKGQVKVGKLRLKREAVKDLTTKDKKKVKGGVVPRTNIGPCGTSPSNCLCNSQFCPW